MFVLSWVLSQLFFHYTTVSCPNILNETPFSWGKRCGASAASLFAFARSDPTLLLSVTVQMAIFRLNLYFAN